MTDPVVVDQSALVLKVQSPGSLPTGVASDKLLSTQSMPRNPCLMNAMRVLGLVEQSSQGFDRMWLSMLISGREAPEVEVGSESVSVTFLAGTPDEAFIQALNSVSANLTPGLTEDVGCVIIFRYLTRHSAVSLSSAVTLLQTSEGTARQIMVFLVQQRLVTPVDTRPDEWILSDVVRSLTKTILSIPLAVPSVHKWIEERMLAGEALTNKEISHATGVPSRDVTDVLRYLASSGVIMKDSNGPSRGPGVRWVHA